MAITHVEGTVTRTFFNGKGAEVTETFTKRDGGEGKTRWAAWFEEPHGLSEGDTVKVSGLHSDEISEWEKGGETRRNIKRSLNKARVQGQQATTAPPAASQAPAEEWSQPNTFDSSVPF
jgi:hypothetical protein